MQTTQIVRGATEVLTITRLRPGDVYKRVEESSYAATTLRYGVVADVMDNGPDAAVVAVEFRPPEFGSGVLIETRVITGNQPLAIFPARPEEVREHMAAMIASAEQAERTAVEAADKAAALTARVRAVAAAHTAGELSAPETSTVPLIDAAENEDTPDDGGQF